MKSKVPEEWLKLFRFPFPRQEEYLERATLRRDCRKVLIRTLDRQGLEFWYPCSYIATIQDDHEMIQ